MVKLTSPDGVTVSVTSPADVVNLKARGYAEVTERAKTPAGKTAKPESKHAAQDKK